MEVYSQPVLEGIACTLGTRLRGGETIELIGDIGAGKTTFTKALAKGMAIDDTIQSPTFTISNRYVSPDGITLAHYDFYRLSDAGIMAEELVETMDDTKTVTVIEWADIVENMLAPDRLQIHFTSVSETERALTITATGPRLKLLLKAL